MASDRLSGVRDPFGEIVWNSVEPEVHFDIDKHWDRLIFVHCGLEPILSH